MPKAPVPPAWLEWDDAKALQNQRVHRLSFALVERFPFESALEALDPDSDEHGEDRFLAIGKIDKTYYALVYAHRREKIRVISFRKAAPEERKIYRSGGEWR